MAENNKNNSGVNTILIVIVLVLIVFFIVWIVRGGFGGAPSVPDDAEFDVNVDLPTNGGGGEGTGEEGQ